jgi:hypothetical protein
MSTAQHTISYAYPSSSMACSLKRASDGCWVLQAGESIAPYPSYADALKAAAAEGSQPSRWSVDHPFNANFIKEGTR